MLKALKSFSRHNIKFLKSYFSNLPYLVLIPFLVRGSNFILAPFILAHFGNSGFVRISTLLLISYLISTMLELGVKQKVLRYSNSGSDLLFYYGKWLRIYCTFSMIFLFLTAIFQKYVAFIGIGEAAIILVDSCLNLSINSFFQTYLQKKGLKSRILKFNINQMFLVFTPKILILFSGLTNPWLWVLMGSVFRSLPLVLPVVNEIKSINWKNHQKFSGIPKVFDLLTLNSLFGILLVFLSSSDKFVGNRVLSVNTMTSYFLAYQFSSLIGTTLEQLSITYYSKISNLIKFERSDVLSKSILEFIVSLTMACNMIFILIAKAIYPSIDTIFFPVLILLSIQPYCWGILIYWQNYLGLAQNNMSHVVGVLIAVLFESVTFAFLLNFNLITPLILSFTTGFCFFLALIYIAHRKRKPSNLTLPSKYIFLHFWIFCVFCLTLNIIRNSSIITIFIAIVSLAIFLDVLRRKTIKIINLSSRCIL